MISTAFFSPMQPIEAMDVRFTQGETQHMLGVLGKQPVRHPFSHENPVLGIQPAKSGQRVDNM